MSKKMILLLTTLTIAQQAHAMELSICELKNKLTHNYNKAMWGISFKVRQFSREYLPERSDVYENLFGEPKKFFPSEREQKRQTNNMLTLLAGTTVATGAAAYLLLNGGSLKTRKLPEASIQFIKASQNLWNTFTAEEKLGLAATSLPAYLYAKAMLSDENSFKEKWQLSRPLMFGTAVGLGATGYSDLALLTGLLGIFPFSVFRP